jgi:hypothetical protein
VNIALNESTESTESNEKSLVKGSKHDEQKAAIKFAPGLIIINRRVVENKRTLITNRKALS